MTAATWTLGNRVELEAVSRQRAQAVPYGNNRVLCRLLGENLAFVDDRDLMLGPRLALDGFWESWVTLALARLLYGGNWCVDVGANYGYFTLLMAGLVGPEGRVVACEPIPALAGDYLPRNLALNGFEKTVEVCPKAVSDADDRTVEFALNADDFASSSLEHWSETSSSEIIQVPTITIDRICADWPRLDLIKIDAEGAEGLIWNGMQKTLRQFPQAIVALELHWKRDPPQALALLHQIEAAGYLLRAINFEGEIVETDRESILSRSLEHWTLWLQK
jgi:FkbM family methyltransferase